MSTILSIFSAVAVLLFSTYALFYALGWLLKEKPAGQIKHSDELLICFQLPNN